MILEPGSAAILDSMGWLEFRLGNFESSARLLRQALDLQFDPEIATHLSAALDALGDRSGARAVLDQALARLPEDPTLRQALDRLGDAR